MSQTSEVIGLLAQTDQQFERKLHPSRRAKALPYTIYGPLYTLAIVIAVTNLIILWQGGNSSGFWFNFPSSLIFSMHIVRGFVFSRSDSDSLAPLHPYIANLREAVRAGDSSLAPIATDHAIDPPAAAPVRIGPLPRPFKWSHPLIVLAILLSVIAIISVPCLFAYVSIQAGTIAGIAMLLLATVCGLLAYRACGPVAVYVGIDGFRWRKILGGHHHLAWRNAQALIRMGDANLFLDDRKTTVILYSADRVFTWNITGSSRRAHIATQSLLHTITQHTGLPLRDVSTEVRHIAYHEGIDPLQLKKPTAQVIKYRFRVLGIAILPFIIMALFALAIPVTKPLSYEYLYMHAHSSTPIYSDPLTHKDSDWPETDSARFTGGAYTITHDLEFFGFHPSLILPPHHYDNVLYEVTARSSGDTNAGLAINGSDTSQPMLAFHATPDGHWWLTQETSDGAIAIENHLFYRFGDSTAIHRGSGAPNRIGVLVQGSDFTFYINGHYITRYHDDHLAGGYTGIFLDPEPGQGAFTDFAIYPA